MQNHKCKGQKLLMLTVMNLYFILLVLKQVNLVAVVILLMIHMQKICVPSVIKGLNVNVFNKRTNETRHIKWHETCT